MPALSQGPNTRDYRILWGYSGYTHLLADSVGLKTAKAEALKWAKANQCRTKVEGYDMDSRQWITFVEYNHTK